MTGPIAGGAGPRAARALRLPRAAAWLPALLLLGAAGAGAAPPGNAAAAPPGNAAAAPPGNAAAAPAAGAVAAPASGGIPGPASAGRVSAAATGASASRVTGRAATTTPVIPTTITATTTVAAAKTAARGPCLPTYGPMTPVPVTLVTKGGRTTATWWHNGDAGAIRYWLGSRPTSGTAQQQAVTSWTRITPPAKVCQTITLAVPGVVVPGSYVVWLDLESRTPETRAQVTRSTLKTLSLVV